MDIIALQGKSNTGKTTTLNILHDSLLLPNINYDASSLGKMKINSIGDFYSIFTHKKTKKLIGIYSEGDSGKSTINANKTFKNISSNMGDFDIIILACRTSGGTVNEIKKIPNSKTMSFVGKSKTLDVSNQQTLNQLDANLLMEYIDYLV